MPGTYEIRGRLYNSSWNWIENIYNTTYLALGIQTVELWFTGWKIYNSKDNGSYNIELRLRDASYNTLDTDTYSTNTYKYDEFQLQPAVFSPPHSDYGLDTDSDGKHNYLIVEVVVYVSVAGNYEIEADLYDSFSKWIEDVYNYTYLNTGIQIVELRFEGWRIHNHGKDGPYIVDLNIRDDSWNWLDNDIHNTASYLFSEFQAPAIFEPPHSDYGLDVDFDSLFNYLVVNVVVNVSEPDSYYIYGELYDGVSTLIDEDINFTFLNGGIQTVELRFLGWRIYINGVDGPYTVDLDLYDNSWNLIDTDAHLTAAYLIPEFQPPPPPIVPPYFNDFEGVGQLFLEDNDNVNPGTKWEWGDPTSYLSGPGGAYSPDNCWGTNLLSEYRGGADIFLYMPVMNLTSVSVSNLTFWHWYYIDSSWEDGGFLEISTNYGQSWSLLNPVGGYPSQTESGVPGYGESVPCYAGVSGGWLQADFDLTAYSGQVILIRFRFWSEPWSESGYPGWYIDDVNVAVLTDVTPPADIMDLTVVGTTVDTATLTWTAPGDDGMSGIATGYEIRYSTIGPITAVNWDAAFEFTQSWAPQPGGNTETHDVTGLAEATQYWFAIMTADEVPNWSGVSNSPSGKTLDITPPQISNVLLDGLPSITVYPGTIVILTAIIDDSLTGNSNIGGANVTNGPQNWPGMNLNPQDGDFDTPTEVATYLIDTTDAPDGSYDLYVYGWDEVPNYNTDSMAYATLIIDSIAPANITDLAVVTTECNLITLTWTAPGDDDMSGTATSYEIRYSTTGIIDDSNWDNATVFTQSWAPLPGGSTETHDVTGLTALTTYWFAIKTADEVPTWSGISNSDSGTTLADILAPQSLNILVDGQYSKAVIPGVVVTLTATISDAMMGNSSVMGANYTIGSQSWPGTVMNPSDGTFDSPIEVVTISVDTTTLNEGAYNLFVYGWDVIPNYNAVSTAHAIIVVDSTPPTSSVDSISPYWQIAEPITVTVTASDTISYVKEVQLFYRFSTDNSSWSSWISVGVDSSDPWEWNFNLPDGDGYYQFRSKATDGAGNVETGIDPDTYCAYDTILPTSSIDEISTFWFTTSPLLITATASDDGSGLESVELFYRFSADNNTWGSWISFGDLTETPFEWSFDFPEGEGYYQFYTVASDKAANEEEGEVAEVFCGYDVTSPTANAGPDQEVEEGDVVTFDGSGSSDNVLLSELTWTFEDETLQTLYGVNPTYTFSTPGNYLITLTITDAVGNSNTDTMWVNVSEIPTTGRITGIIEDENGDPIAGATVTVEGTNLKAVTDETGHYTIPDVPEGTYDLTVTKGGYETTTIPDVTVNAGEDTQNDPMAMEKSPKEEPAGLPDYWWILLLIIVILVIILIMFLARPKGKAPESFGDLEPMAPETESPPPVEEAGFEEPQAPLPDKEQIPPPDETPSPEEIPPPPPPE
ncbi:MAG: carboxypeptidase regulatory-like domain-containing protein [Thermoplasmata archaeon]|nr:MAG: carboxypeptidase regulatory-like domain-containing protein [Thermoplasmata archaeon]